MYNGEYRVKMNADSQWAIVLVVYGVVPVLVLVVGYFGWRRIRPHCRRYGAEGYRDRASQRKKFWGYE